MNITDLIKSQMTPQNLSVLSGLMGGADERKTEQASNAIVSSLLSALTKNASTSDGASGIFKALVNDHDGSIMDDPIGFITGKRQMTNARALNGSGIVGHLLGSNVGGTADMISKVTGIDAGMIQKMMPMLAPMVMGAVGKTMRSNFSQEEQNPQRVQQMLRQTVEKERSQNPMIDMATKFLDSDGDGSVVDDVLGMLGKFLKR